MVRLIDEAGKVLANNAAGPNLFVLEISSPQIAQKVEPGQFVHVKLPGMEGHILRRPFSIYDVDDKAGTLEILYQCVGSVTKWMPQVVAGSAINLIGPIGQGWQPPAGVKRALLVGGGVGAAPLYLLAQQLVGQGVEVETILGAQTKDALATHGRYLELLSDRVSCSTDDGTFGHAGFCTPLVSKALDVTDFDYVAVCGPEPLMKLVADIASEHKVLCQISLEKRMACGVGACLSCVVDTVDGRKRSCVDGPVFDAAKVVW